MYEYLNYIFTGGGVGVGGVIIYYIYKKCKINSSCTENNIEIKLDFKDIEKSADRVIEMVDRNDNFKKHIVKKMMSIKNFRDLFEEEEFKRKIEGLHIGHDVEMA